jgi:hypothetical protein
MNLQKGRDLFRGTFLLIAAATGYWVNPDFGLVLAGFLGAMILQSAFTDWCPADLFLRPLGLQPKREGRR